MGSNILGKEVSFQKIEMGPCVCVISQYKKDNRCLPAQTQLPTNAMHFH
jgi:hypothetical protein